MNKLKTHKMELLIEVYKQDEIFIKNLTDDELDKLLEKKQKEEIVKAKNPNSFFILKDLPAPKEYKTTTSKYVGLLVIIAFILVMLGFLGIFIYLAFSANT